MEKILNPFEKLLVGLVDQKIQYITVGGLACAFNGHVRSTEDVDILIKRNPENIRQLLRFLSSYGEGFAKELQESDFSDEEGAIRIIEEFPIDIFTVMSGNHFEDFESLVRHVEIQGRQIPYLSAPGLIQLKKNSIRQKDQFDVL